MKKKNILTIALALSLVAVLAVGATLAYFTDDDSEFKVFTLGKVDIDLMESDSKLADGDSTWSETIDYPTVIPGDTTPLTKRVRVKVEEDSEDCYVCLMVTIENSKVDTDKIRPGAVAAIYDSIKAAIKESKTMALGTADTDSDVWDDSYWDVQDIVTDTVTTGLLCVYVGPTAPADGEALKACAVKAKQNLTLFETLSIPAMGTDGNPLIHGGEDFKIIISAYAIQAANITDGADGNNLTGAGSYDWWNSMFPNMIGNHNS